MSPTEGSAAIVAPAPKAHAAPPHPDPLQRLVNLVFTVAQTTTQQRNHFVGHSPEETRQWVCAKLTEAGFHVDGSGNLTDQAPNRTVLMSVPEYYRLRSNPGGELVVPDWFSALPMQQQSVLLLAARGPDGVRKAHPCKEVVRAYRGTVLRAAKYGRSLEWGEKADSFMSLDVAANASRWEYAVRAYFDHVDELPHHYHLHLLHGAQILGAHHPDPRYRQTWAAFYLSGCEDAHMEPESTVVMDKRLGDWDRAYWDSEQPSAVGRMID